MATLEELRAQKCHVEATIKQIQSKVQSLLDKEEQLRSQKNHIDREIKILEGQAVTADLKHLTSEDFPWSTELRENLKAFNAKEFRPKQLEVINATLSKKDVIAIMPTGGGKSLCYQLPALISKGITLVITPLISLMENQVFNLQEKNIEAHMLTAGSSKETVKMVHAEMIKKEPSMSILYITPEKIAKSKRFMAQLEKCYKAGNLSRIAIDEVHCASQWGNDFRPDYKILGLLRRQFPDVPIIGLTATSTDKVTNNTREILNIPFALVIKTSLNRANLYYEIRNKPTTHKEVIEDITETINKSFQQSSGIIYCFSRKDCETLAKDLCQKGIQCAAYHAQLTDESRTRVHTLWLTKKVQVICATVAFGMGIDKPDVRFVFHHCLPKSVENYYQESGRAGRDGLPALCLLYFGFSDVFRQSSLVLTESTGLKNLNLMLKYCNNNTKCRRQDINEHFGQKWESKMCNKSCDVCTIKKEIIEKDVTNMAKSILEILQSNVGNQDRLTGLKLVEAASGKGKFKTTNKALKSADNEFVKKIILQMLEEEYIREDFHFTPYSTISYLEPAHRSQLLFTDKTKRISINLPAKIYDGQTAYKAHCENFVLSSNQNKTKKRKISDANPSDDYILKHQKIINLD